MRLSGNPARRVAAVRAPISEPPRPCQRAPDAAVPRAFPAKADETPVRGRRHAPRRCETSKDCSLRLKGAPRRRPEGGLPDRRVKHHVRHRRRHHLRQPAVNTAACHVGVLHSLRTCLTDQSQDLLDARPRFRRGCGVHDLDLLGMLRFRSRAGPRVLLSCPGAGRPVGLDDDDGPVGGAADGAGFLVELDRERVF